MNETTDQNSSFHFLIFTSRRVKRLGKRHPPTFQAIKNIGTRDRPVFVVAPVCDVRLICLNG